MSKNLKTMFRGQINEVMNTRNDARFGKYGSKTAKGGAEPKTEKGSLDITSRILLRYFNVVLNVATYVTEK